MQKHRLAAALVLAAALCAALAASAGAAKGHGHGSTTYEFRGDLASASASAVQLTVEGGNHDALLQKGGYYYRLVQMQEVK